MHSLSAWKNISFQVKTASKSRLLSEVQQVKHFLVTLQKRPTWYSNPLYQTRTFPCNNQSQTVQGFFPKRSDIKDLYTHLLLGFLHTAF